VLVVGDAGIGKTRFVGEGLARAAASGMSVISGGCLPLAEKLPLLPVADALDGLGRLDGGALFEAALAAAPAFVRPEVARLLPRLAMAEPVATAPVEGWRHERLFAGIAELLGGVARRSPLVLLIEDVHWADGATLDFLTYLPRADRADPVTVVVTCRSDEVPLDVGAADWLTHVRRDASVVEIRLGPLSRAEVAEHVGGLVGATPPGGLVEEVYARAEGHPLPPRPPSRCSPTPTRQPTGSGRSSCVRPSPARISVTGWTCHTCTYKRWMRWRRPATGGGPEPWRRRHTASSPTTPTTPPPPWSTPALPTPAWCSMPRPPGLPLMKEALRLFEGTPPSAEYAKACYLYPQYFLMHAEGTRPEEIFVALNRALEVAEAAGATTLIPQILGGLADKSFHSGKVDDGFRLLARARSLPEASRDAWAVLTLAVVEAGALFCLGRLEEAIDVGLGCVEVVRQGGLGSSLVASVLWATRPSSCTSAAAPRRQPR
jgi:hypothetical protein